LACWFESSPGHRKPCKSMICKAFFMDIYWAKKSRISLR